MPRLYALAAMMIMIIAVDQLLWRPIVVWATKFRVEEGGDQRYPYLLVPQLVDAARRWWRYVAAGSKCCCPNTDQNL